MRNLLESETGHLNYCKRVVEATNRYHELHTWIDAQIKLCRAYISLPSNVESEAQIEKALEILNKALKIAQEKGDEDQIEEISTEIAHVYSVRIKGDRVENLRMSTELEKNLVNESYSQCRITSWARIMVGFANSYLTRGGSDNDDDNIERAICYLEAALICVNKSSEPELYGQLNHLFGKAWLLRSRGDSLETLPVAVNLLREGSEALKSIGKIDFYAEVAKIRMENEIREISHSRGMHADFDFEREFDIDEELPRKIKDLTNAMLEQEERYWAIEDAEKWLDSRIPRIHLMLFSIYSNVQRLSPEETLEIAQFEIPKVLTAVEEALKIAKSLGIASKIKELFGLKINTLTVTQGGMIYENDLYENGGSGFSAQSVYSLPDEYVNLTEDLISAQKQYVELKSKNRVLRDYLIEQIKLIELCIEAQKWSDAQEVLEQVLKDIEIESSGVNLKDQSFKIMLQIRGEITNYGFLIYARLGKEAKAIYLMELGRLQVYRNEQGIKEFSDHHPNKETLVFLNRKLKECEGLLSSPSVANRIQLLDDSITCRSEIDKLIQGKSPVNPPTFLEIFNYLDVIVEEGMCFIAPCFLKSMGRAVVAYRDDGQMKFDTFEIGNFENLLHAHTFHASFCNIVGSKDVFDFGGLLSDSDIHDFQQMMSLCLFNGLENWLDENDNLGIKHITFYVDGMLASLPLCLGAYDCAQIIEDFSISVCAGIHVQGSNLRELSNQKSLMTVANPTSFAPDLKFSEMEGSVAASWPSIAIKHVLPKEKATLISTINAMGKTNIWHFACHGSYVFGRDDPTQILLSNGEMLNAEVLENLNAKPDVVILSACESGKIDNNTLPSELVGLPASFFKLGALFIIVTLWSVSDFVTCLVIGKFYQFWLNNSLEIADALRRSQLWVSEATVDDISLLIDDWRHEKRIDDVQHAELFNHLRGNYPSSEAPFSSPYYWAGFVCYGTGVGC